MLQALCLRFCLIAAAAGACAIQAFIGMGFRDRSESYDFNATIQDHWNSVKRQVEADAMRAEMEARLASEPMRDLSLKEGEKLNIKVNVPGGGRERPKRAEREGGLTLPGGLLPPPPKPGMLAPPPPPAAVPPATAAPTAPSATAADDGFGDLGASGGDDGFGDFSAADAADGGADDGFGDFSSG